VLAIVPAGAGNDLARHLGIPRGDANAACALLRDGGVVRCDLGYAETDDGARAWFTTVANAGFDAEANRWANGVQRVSGTALYVAAVLRTLTTFRSRRVRVTADAAVLDTPGWLVAVANTRSYAGGMMIAPDAALDDGALDVCLVGNVSRADFLLTFPKVFDGTHVEHPSVAVARATQIMIEMPGSNDEPELWASGERVGRLPASVVAVPGAVRVVTSR